MNSSRHLVISYQSDTELLWDDVEFESLTLITTPDHHSSYIVTVSQCIIFL